MIGYSSGSTTVSYTYNNAGYRMSETVNGQTTTFLNDPTQAYDQVLEEYAPGGVLAATYIRGIDLLFQDRSGARSFYVVDNIGSTRGLTNAVGVLTDVLTYDAYGNILVHTGATANEFLYAGMQLDSATGQYYDRARYYDAGAGAFTSRDSYDGELSDPATENHYTYAGDGPTGHTDPSGHWSLGVLMTTLSLSFGGASLGVGVNAVANYAQGRALLYGATEAAIWGGLLTPLAFAFPVLGLGAAGWGIWSSANLTVNVFRNPNSTAGQDAAAIGLLALSVFGAYGAGKNVQMNGYWYNQNYNLFAPAPDQLGISTGPETGQSQPTLLRVPREDQDIAVAGRGAPEPNNGYGVQISQSAAQDAALQAYISWLTEAGADDIRVNQNQTNIHGKMVGVNRPDLQFTLDSSRWYIEWNRPGNATYAKKQGQRILANDPGAKILLFSLE